MLITYNACLVTVHSATQVKITDFGLAKLLATEESYLATGGKVIDSTLVLADVVQSKLSDYFFRTLIECYCMSLLS
jgi:hypothetical protein